MPLGQVRGLLDFIGIVLQFGGAILLVALFLLLRPYAARRRYFRTWTKAWLALCAATGAVVVRYIVQPSFGEAMYDEKARRKVGRAAEAASRGPGAVSTA